MSYSIILQSFAVTNISDIHRTFVHPAGPVGTKCYWPIYILHLRRIKTFSFLGLPTFDPYGIRVSTFEPSRIGRPTFDPYGIGVTDI